MEERDFGEDLPEEKLARDHELFRVLLDNIPDSIYFKDRENRFIKVNRAKAEEQGTTPEEMIGKTDFDYFPEDQAKGVFEDDNRVMETGEPQISKLEKIRGADGSERWVTSTKIPRYNSEGKIIGTMGISRDVTERVRAEREVQRSEERYRSTIENANVGVGVYGPDRELKIFNSKMKEIIGYSRSEVPTLAHCFRKLYPDSEVRGKISDAWFDRISRQGYISGEEAEFTDKNGDRRTLLLNAVQMSAGDVLFFAQDITKRKVAELMLTEARDRFEELFEGANEVVMTTDPEGYIHRINKMAERVSGYDKKELVGESFLKIILPEDHGKAIEFWKEILEGKESIYRLKGINKGGDVIYFRAGGRPILEDGEIVEIQYNAQDITELEETQRELERRKEELEEKTKELESFVYTVSHDLRTPLVSLEGFSDLLREEYGKGLGEEGKHYIDRIQANVVKMDDFIDDLLQLSRIGRKKPPKENVEIEGIVRRVVDELSPRIEDRGIEIMIGDDLPTLYFEEKRLYQIYSNFISNACKFMGDQESPKVEVDAREKDRSWLLWVRDNGIGIGPEDHEKIFEIFQQAEVSDRGGTGVGLSIVKRIVETHGGTVWVESEKGRGSTFFVEFPKEEVQGAT